MNKTINQERFTFDIGEALDSLNLQNSLNKNLGVVSSVLKRCYPDITRVTVSIFDNKTNTLKSFLSNKGVNDPLVHLEADIDSLEEISALRDTSKRNIIRYTKDHPSSYTAVELLKHGYQSSYIVPIFDEKRFFGVVSLSSTQRQSFDELHTRIQLDVVIKLIAVLVVSEAYTIWGLKGTAQTLKEVAILRDNETGEHLERMSRFSRLIARTLATKYGLDDEFIEELFQCAPLHDLGKIGIPDSILLKPGKLSNAEFEMMKEHPKIGKDIITKVVSNLHINEKNFCKLLVNIVFSHHENWDGSGYPIGSKETEIPIEARIVRVADVYDALTSERPYKEAWPSAKAIRYLKCNIGTIFDPDCVEAACKLEQKFIQISQEFTESRL